MQRLFALFLTVIFLTACASPTPTAPANVILTSPDATPTPTVLPPQPSAPAPTALPTMSAGGLVVMTRQLTEAPNTDTLAFVTVQGDSYDSQSLQRNNPFSYQWNESGLGMWAMAGEDKLVTAETDSADCKQTWVTVTRNGDEIYRIDSGMCSPVGDLWGFFAVDGHWVLETNDYTDADPYQGKLTLDGVLLNDQNNYQQAFGAQTIGGKLFYFFQRDGKFNAWYDGQELLLGYDQLSHHGCCSEGILNPQKWLDQVAFFGVRNGTWYFVQIGTPASFVQ